MTWISASRLHAGRDAEYQGLTHEYDEAAEADGCQSRIAEKSDHRCVDDIEEILRYHAPDNGQGEAEDALAADRVHVFFLFLSLGQPQWLRCYDLDFDCLI